MCVRTSNTHTLADLPSGLLHSGFPNSLCVHSLNLKGVLRALPICSALPLYPPRFRPSTRFLFQGFLEANLKCFWNASLLEAMRLLEFQGYVAPGVLLVTASACALEVVRGAWARNVLKPPNNYVIAVVGECLSGR